MELVHAAQLDAAVKRGAADRVVDIQRDGNVWHVKSRLMNTPCGQVIRGILESGGQVGYSTFGGGSTTLRPDGIKEVTDFYLLGFDCVSNPSIAKNVEAVLEAVQFNVIDGRLARITADTASYVKSRRLTEDQKTAVLKDFLRKVCEV